jgi:hypothetical protein
VLASLAAARTGALQAAGVAPAAALNGGYHVAFLAGALFAVAAAGIGAFGLRAGRPVETGAVPAMH